MPKKIYMIEAHSVHASYYAVQSDNMPDYDLLKERLQSGTLHELSQEWLGEDIESIVELSEQEFLKHPAINYIDKSDHKKDLIDDLDVEVRYEDNSSI